MTFARWSRWGRGLAEGYSLEFGVLIRCDVEPVKGGERWSARMNRGYLGEFATIEEAQIRCEQEALQQLRQAAEFSNRFHALPDKGKGRGRRGRKHRSRRY